MLQPKTQLGGHSLILGRPWLATVDALTSYRSVLMIISNGNSTKNIVLYPPTKPIEESENPLWAKCETKEGNSFPQLTIGKYLCFKDEIKDDRISTFISNPPFVTPTTSHFFNVFMDEENEERPPEETLVEAIHTTLNSKSISIEIELRKTLNINPALSPVESKWLVQLLKENQQSFAWDYTDMMGISPNFCTHHIYTWDYFRHV